jgi:hypothetical protein
LGVVVLAVESGHQCNPETLEEFRRAQMRRAISSEEQEPNFRYSINIDGTGNGMSDDLGLHTPWLS